MKKTFRGAVLIKNTIVQCQLCFALVQEDSATLLLTSSKPLLQMREMETYCKET